MTRLSLVATLKFKFMKKFLVMLLFIWYILYIFVMRNLGKLSILT